MSASVLYMSTSLDGYVADPTDMLGGDDGQRRHAVSRERGARPAGVLAVARPLVDRNPEMSFVYISGQGTDSTGQGGAIWARVKGRTENALLALPFRTGVMLRPGIIQPVEGARSNTGWYRAMYTAMGPLWPLLRRLLPGRIVTTAELGRAMLAAARLDGTKTVLGAADIVRLARAAPPV